MKLTEHFTLHEFERSATAEKYHIDSMRPNLGPHCLKGLVVTSL